MNKSSQKKIKNSLKNKKILLANWGCKHKDCFQCRDWIPILKKLFQNLIIFSLRNHYYFYGKKSLNEKFLEIIEKEKPDYLIFGHRYNEIEINTIKKIKEISPKTKTIIEYGDDDFRFDDWGRYYALFFDYIWTSKKELEIYEKDNIKNAFFAVGINPDYYKPLKIKKEYEVSFIGRPVADRYDYIKFLLDNKINIKLFGTGWEKYPEFKDIYKGFLYDTDFMKVMNQSKINLNFSKTMYNVGKKGQMKGRIFEVPACKAFLLNEYTDMNPNFINKEKKINFKTKKELIQKINYYLKNEKEREKITEKIYKEVINNWTWESFFIKFFEKAEKDKIQKKEIPKFNKKIFKITKKEINLSLKEIKNKLKNTDYIYFSKGIHKDSKYKLYFQTYSLMISKKQISCCDYYFYNNLLGDYLIFKSKNSFNTLDKKEFNKFFNINQLMVTKNYFLKNLETFKKIYNKKINSKTEKIMNAKNIIFISIPLIKIKNISKFNYNEMYEKENIFCLFSEKIFSLVYQKKIFHPYIFKLIFSILLGNYFLLKFYSNQIFNKNKKEIYKNIFRTLGLLK